MSSSICWTVFRCRVHYKGTPHTRTWDPRLPLPDADHSIPNPLRLLGVARIVTGAWFVASGVAMLRQHVYLVGQARRLFSGDIGGTDAPVRSLLVLVSATLLLILGPMLVYRGFAWLRRVPLPPAGPAALAQDEVVATLRDHRLTSYALEPAQPHWLLRRPLSEELADMTWWRRAILNRGIRAFARSCGLAVVVAGISLAVPYVVAGDLLGPFPLAFVAVLPFVTGIWAALALLLIGMDIPRVESEQWSLPAKLQPAPAGTVERISESPLRPLGRELTGLGLTMGIFGALVQCLSLSWWNLATVGFPMLATSAIRHGASIATAILFFVLGDRIVQSGAELLQDFRYESLLVLVDVEEGRRVARAAAVRTESRGVGGPRHILAAVGGPHVRETAPGLIGA